jgi:AraC-like DNA-binding protein
LELKEHPEYTIEAIAQDCGFSSLRTFQRTFKDFMGMTSTEYRKAVASQV